MQTLQSASRLAILSAVLVACSGGSGSNARTGTLTISATATVSPAGPVLVPLATGQLELDSSLFHVGDLEIEVRKAGEHEASSSGNSHASENEGGEHGSGNEHEEENENENASEHENEHENEEVVDEIHLPGPYTFDLAAGPTVIDQVPVVPGTFDSVDLRFVVTADPPFDTSSILVRGFFIDGTVSTPFTLRSDFHGGMRVPIANGGITVTANSVVPVELQFDLNALFGHLDFASATVENGEILIDVMHNVMLLLVFEAGLHTCANAHERDD